MWHKFVYYCLFIKTRPDGVDKVKPKQGMVYPEFRHLDKSTINKISCRFNRKKKNIVIIFKSLLFSPLGVCWKSKYQ